MNLPASHDAFDPTTSTARNQDTPQVIPKKSHTRPIQAHHMHKTVHGCHSELTHSRLWSANT